MGVEIERKFLVASDRWRDDAHDARKLRQTYLVADRERSVRVRLADGEAWLTIKGAHHGLERAEFEYPLPPDDAEQLLALAPRPPLEKTRWHVTVGDHVWEVDEFHGAHAPLVLAEVELASGDESCELPPWLGREVSTDERYTNAWLWAHPPRGEGTRRG